MADSEKTSGSWLWPGRSGFVNYITAEPGKAFCDRSPHRVTILGCTGSIGCNALAIAEQYPEQIRVIGLGAGRNFQLLARQANLFRPPLLAVQDETARAELARLLPAAYKPEILVGPGGYASLAAFEGTDLLVSAQSGAAGLIGTLAAALAGRVIALANKESLVLAGGLLRAICARSGASILPVDSEHYALFTCMAGRGQTVAQLILTASGGPFRHFSGEELAKVTPEQALAHPSWSMGAKITIDSATLMNKGLEIIEAMHLFGMPFTAVKVLVHPQSVIHSLVLFKDNGMLAQMAVPDMKLPIASAMLWPHMPLEPVPVPDLAAIGRLDFFEPDTGRFPCLALAMELCRNDIDINRAAFGNSCLVMNAANEEAVKLFCAGKIDFNDIAAMVDLALRQLAPTPNGPECEWRADKPTTEALRLWETAAQLDAEARRLVAANVGACNGK